MKPTETHHFDAAATAESVSLPIDESGQAGLDEGREGSELSGFAHYIAEGGDAGMRPHRCHNKKCRHCYPFADKKKPSKKKAMHFIPVVASSIVYPLAWQLNATNDAAVHEIKDRQPVTRNQDETSPDEEDYVGTTSTFGDFLDFLRYVITSKGATPADAAAYRCDMGGDGIPSTSDLIERAVEKERKRNRQKIEELQRQINKLREGGRTPVRQATSTIIMPPVMDKAETLIIYHAEGYQGLGGPFEPGEWKNNDDEKKKPGKPARKREQNDAPRKPARPFDLPMFYQQPAL